MSLTPVAVALEKILAGKSALGPETVALTEAFGRVLAEDIVSKRTQPPANVSAMDGYALCHGDSQPLKVIGESAAGHPFGGSVSNGQAVRIFTGAFMPEGADCVLLQEDVSRDGDLIRFEIPPRQGQHIRAKGLDFSEGVIGLTKGTVLNARALALAAAMNHAAVPVIKRPRVALISTGDELKPPGSNLGPADIVSSNATMLLGQMQEAGAIVDDFGIVGDSLAATLAALQRAKAGHYDVVVTSGGASVGDYDFMQEAIRHEGAELGFWKLAMRPGKPLMLADFGPLRLLGLPGNPVSSFVCAELFVKPLLKKLGGHDNVGPHFVKARLGSAMKANDQRADYVRGTLQEANGTYVATPFSMQDSSMMRVLAESQCLILRPPFALQAQAGDDCDILLI